MIKEDSLNYLKYITLCEVPNNSIGNLISLDTLEMSPKVSALLRKARNGDSQAQYDLAVCYMDGDGVVRNESEAFRWYEKSAKQGNMESQYALAVFYMNTDQNERKFLGSKMDVKNILLAYDYLSSAKKNGHASAEDELSINCVFNNGYKCTCSVSVNREKTCVGEHNCDDFERCSFSRPDLYKEAKAKNSNHAENNTKPTATYKNKTAKKSTNPKYLVERGNRINVVAVKTGEEIHLQVIDSKNPFYMKSLNSIVIIKGEEYRISEIFKR